MPRNGALLPHSIYKATALTINAVHIYDCLLMFSVLLRVVELGTLWYVRMPNLIKEIACTTHITCTNKLDVVVMASVHKITHANHAIAYPPVAASLDVATARFDTTESR